MTDAKRRSGASVVIRPVLGLPRIGERWWIGWRGVAATITGLPWGTGVDFRTDSGIECSICANEWRDAVRVRDVFRVSASVESAG